MLLLFGLKFLKNHHADRCHMPVWSWWFDVNIWRWCGAPYPICINVGSGALAAAAAEAAEADPRPTAAAAACISAAEPQTSSGDRAYSGLTPWWLKCREKSRILRMVVVGTHIHIYLNSFINTMWIALELTARMLLSYSSLKLQSYVILLILVN